MIEHRVTLPDGRRLAAAEVGDPHGVPVIYTHGFPGSRFGIALAASAARSGGVRAIALERPGWGESDPAHGRTLDDWPRDVAAAADTLGCPRFHLLGVSGGGPFTLACAAALRDRVGRVAVVCGVGPPESAQRGDGMLPINRLGLALARRAPWTTRPAMGLFAPLLRRFGEAAVDHLARHAGAADRRVLTDPALRPVLVREFREGFRHGGAGAAADGRIYGTSWPLDLGAIDRAVYLWHGEADRVVPAAMTRWVAARLPDARPTYGSGAGHFSTVIDCIPQILEVLAVDPAC